MTPPISQVYSSWCHGTTEWEHEQAKYYLYISCNSHTVFLLLLNYIRKRKFDYFIIVA